MKFWLKDILRDKEPEGGGGGDKTPVADKPDDKAPKSDKDTEAALALYRALQDPDIGTEVIENLARRAGLLERDKGRRSKDNDDDNKPKESRAAKLLKAKLGKDYEKFADTVGPAFDEILAEAIGELKNSHNVDRETEKWGNQVDKFMDSHTLTEDIENKMRELMEEAPPNNTKKGFDAQRYLSRMYKNACEELDIEVPKARRSRSNDNDDTDDGNPPRFVIRERPKGATIDDAVEAAMQGIRFKRK
jgi:hypothetical protein